jgi:hypothetical protein
MFPDFEGADAIGSYWGNPGTRTFAELLIDCEEDRTLRAGARRHAAGRRQARALTIADRLVISEGAVEKHVANIFAKLGLSVSESDNRRVLAVLQFCSHENRGGRRIGPIVRRGDQGKGGRRGNVERTGS